ncbi:MAG: hypothetical protein ACRC62_13720 [Microcoleus sp.]
MVLILSRRKKEEGRRKSLQAASSLAIGILHFIRWTCLIQGFT